jgi:ATP-binding cassette subfamily C (CFTR/MRP) protein 1
VAVVVVVAKGPIRLTRASLPATILSLIATSTLAILSPLKHTCSLRPSTAINVYLLASVLGDIPRTRTLWLMNGHLLLARMFSCSLAAKVMMLFLETLEKRHLLRPSALMEADKEGTSGIFVRSMFAWVNPLLYQGFRVIIRQQDLFPIDKKLCAEELEGGLPEVWRKCRANHHTKLQAFANLLLPISRSRRRLQKIFISSSSRIIEMAHHCRHHSSTFASRIHLRTAFSHISHYHLRI